MASKSLNAHFREILRDVNTHVREAAIAAGKQAMRDVDKEAKTYLQHYYDSYDPEQYDRTHHLQNAIKPFVHFTGMKKNSKTIRITVGVKYDANALRGHYTSNSWYHQSGTQWISRLDGDFDFDSQNNGIPEPEWILNNFLHGQHGGYQQDFNSTYTLMDDFLQNTLPKRMNQYIQRAVWRTLTSGL